MKYHFHRFPVLFGAMLALGLGLCVTSCSKKDAEGAQVSIDKEEVKTTSSKDVSSSTQAKDAVEESQTSETPMASETKAAVSDNPQTYDEYVATLGEIAKKNQSMGRRSAMASKVLQEREKTLLEENEGIKAAQEQVEALKAQLKATQEALEEAQKKLADQYASDAKWVEAKAKVDAVAKEAGETRARTALLIREAHKKGIHIQPQPRPQAPEEPTTLSSDSPEQ